MFNQEAGKITPTAQNIIHTHAQMQIEIQSVDAEIE
jgi:hypothetical protein